MERKQHKNSDDTVKTITRPKTIVHEYFANDYYYYDHTNKFHVSNESNVISIKIITTTIIIKIKIMT